MVAQSISRTTAELAVVRFTYRCPESQRHCYPDGFVLQVESQTGDWEGLHPGGGVGLCGSKKTHPDHLVCPIQQTLLRRLRERLIPSALLALF